MVLKLIVDLDYIKYSDRQVLKLKGDFDHIKYRDRETIGHVRVYQSIQGECPACSYSCMGLVLMCSSFTYFVCGRKSDLGIEDTAKCHVLDPCFIVATSKRERETLIFTRQKEFFQICSVFYTP